MIFTWCCDLIIIVLEVFRNQVFDHFVLSSDVVVVVISCLLFLELPNSDSFDSESIQFIGSPVIGRALAASPFIFILSLPAHSVITVV